MMKKITKVANSYQGRFAIILSLIVLVLVLGAVAVMRNSSSPIPKSILASAKFPVYYPDTSQLPAGFSLNQKSIQYINPGVVIFLISYQHKQSIVVSEEVKPQASVINQYNSDYIPLHITFPTSMGQAILGAYNDGKNGLRSVVSLPINNGPWLIATAPGNISHAQYEQVIESMVAS